jgi:hypothetical protein
MAIKVTPLCSKDLERENLGTEERKDRKTEGKGQDLACHAADEIHVPGTRQIREEAAGRVNVLWDRPLQASRGAAFAYPRG